MLRSSLHIIFILTVFLPILYGQQPSNLFKNGSFAGVPGEDSHGEGWNTGSSPDLNDTTSDVHTSVGYHWVKKPIRSNDGGPWQNLYSYREFLEQKVELEVGVVYTIILEYASQPITADGFTFDQPVGINIYIDDELKYSTPRDKTPYTWEKACFQFTAQLRSHTIKFSASDEQYVGIDGVKLVKGNLCSRTP
jgi:hypothetical protein